MTLTRLAGGSELRPRRPCSTRQIRPFRLVERELMKVIFEACRVANLLPVDFPPAILLPRALPAGACQV